MPLPFFCKGLLQLCSPIAIARLVYTCVFYCWIWLCLWHESIHFSVSILWVTAKHCPHLQYELWSFCPGLWISQQIDLWNGCRNDESISFPWLFLDNMGPHQILARSQLGHRRKTQKPESCCNSLVVVFLSSCYQLPLTGKGSEYVGLFATPQNIEGISRWLNAQV